MRADARNTTFIFQFQEDCIKALKCERTGRSGIRFVACAREEISPGSPEAVLADATAAVLNRLGYARNPVIVSLPRARATTRYLKVPTALPAEIEKIISLQAPRFLPYPAEELVTGYDIVGTDKEGYSDLNVIVVPKDVIARLVNIFDKFRPASFSIILSAYGLCGLYRRIMPAASGAVMLADINSSMAEVAIARGDKVLFSRNIRLARANPNWETLLAQELERTRSTYLKEVSDVAPERIILFGQDSLSPELTDAIARHTGLSAEKVSYLDKADIKTDAAKAISASGTSFAALAGLGLYKYKESLNLIPQERKARINLESRKRERARFGLLVAGILLLSFFGAANHLRAKASYLERLDAELERLAQEAKPLEDMERGIRFVQMRAGKGPSLLDLLYELEQAMPSGVSLVTFAYEDGKDIAVRGEAQELDGALSFASKLKARPAFKGFDIKVRYATKKRTQRGEVVDFEIVSARQR